MANEKVGANHNSRAQQVSLNSFAVLNKPTTEEVNNKNTWLNFTWLTVC